MGASCCKPEAIDFDGEVNLFHFYLLRSVGKGAFGKVRVVQHKQTKQLLALKYINKAKCCKMKAVANIIQERRLLEEIDHPFVVNLRYAFQDDEHCFFVLDLMLGGDLRFHLDRLGGLDESAVRFMVAEISSALDYLHSIRIVHRDLKPDNVLLDERGHVHLTDFNIAVHFAPSGRQLTGIAGSMAYMAPEVLARRGYSCQIDWWSLGVIVYELLFGRRPFRGKTNSALTESIAGDRLGWPDDGDAKCSAEGKAFIAGLLERDPQRRLGWRAGGGGLADIKATPWLSSFDWPAIVAKKGTPVFVPDAKKANFDATHELEELLLEENPLKARKRKPNQDVALMSTDMRMMEEHFRVYDFKRQPRQTYYHAPTAAANTQTTSAATAATASTLPVATPTSSEYLAARGPSSAAGGGGGGGSATGGKSAGGGGGASATAGGGGGGGQPGTLHVGPAGERTETPTAQLISRTGAHVEEMIADGGGMGRNRGLYDDDGNLRRPEL